MKKCAVQNERDPISTRKKSLNGLTNGETGMFLTFLKIRVHINEKLIFSYVAYPLRSRARHTMTKALKKMSKKYQNHKLSKDNLGLKMHIPRDSKVKYPLFFQSTSVSNLLSRRKENRDKSMAMNFTAGS